MLYNFDSTITIAVIINLVALIINLILFILNYRQSFFQKRIQKLSILRQFHDDLRKWANDVVDSMSEAIFMCDLSPEKNTNDFFYRRYNLRIKLSSLIDKGRWFLPNEKIDKYGREKPLAYRGFRKEALNIVLNTYNFVGKMDYTKQKPNLELREELANNKKYFVSEILKELDPYKIDKEKDELLCK